MPIKTEIESQFSTIFEKIDKNIQVKYIYPVTHRYKNTSFDYIKENYTPLSEINNKDYDGFIITGAPIEKYDFEKIDFWQEIDIFFKTNLLPTVYICWGAQSALYSKFGIQKYELKKKLFGVYKHTIKVDNPFIKNDFYAPHSRNTYNKKECLKSIGLTIVGESEDAGVYMCTSKNYKDIFIFGHNEYQKERLKLEFERDRGDIPKNYFKEDNPNNEPIFNWESHRDEFYKNWINFIGGKL